MADRSRSRHHRRARPAKLPRGSPGAARRSRPIMDVPVEHGRGFVTDLRDQLQTTLGDAYAVERELTGGGMSRVFVAEDRALGRKVVFKVLPSELSSQLSEERFRRE